MKTCITGGGGFVGTYLVRRLQAAGHEVRVLSRQPGRKHLSGTETIEGDLAKDNSPLPEFLAGCDVLFHCAGEIRNQAAMKELHVEGTARLLAAARGERGRTGRRIHWVQLSSIGAYGAPKNTDATDRAVAETMRGEPTGVYEVTKTQSDEMVMLAAQAGDITTTIVRPSKIVGAEMPDNSLRTLARLIHRGLFFYVGRPGAVATYVHVRDVAEALLVCGLNPRAKGEIYNVSNDCPLEALVAAIAVTVGRPPPRLRIPEKMARIMASLATPFGLFPLTQERINGLVRRTRYPYTKILAELGFQPKIAIPEAIGEVIQATKTLEELKRSGR